MKIRPGWETDRGFFFELLTNMNQENGSPMRSR